MALHYHATPGCTSKEAAEGYAPCPFCGSTNLGVLMNATRREGRYMAAVICYKCSARGPVMEIAYCQQTPKGPVSTTAEAHRSYWNRRHKSDGA